MDLLSPNVKSITESTLVSTTTKVSEYHNLIVCCVTCNMLRAQPLLGWSLGPGCMSSKNYCFVQSWNNFLSSLHIWGENHMQAGPR